MEIRATQLSALGYYRQTLAEIQKSHERIVTARAINRGADNPVNLQLSKGFEAQERGIIKAIENTQDGISLVQTADEKLNKIQNMLFRIRDLAVRAANEALFTCPQWKILNDEARSLVDEIGNTAKTALFNSKKILTGDPVIEIKADLATQATVSSGGGVAAFAPSWSAQNEVTFTQQIDPAASRPGVGQSFRVFTQQIDVTNNTTVGLLTQSTDDPDILADADADLYYDDGSGINDPVDSNPLYPANDPDVDGDGYPASVDNDDTSNVETGTGLNALNADIVHATNAVVNSKDFTPYNNAEIYTFSGGSTMADQITATVNAGVAYEIQYSNSGGAPWTTIITSSGTGAAQTFNSFGTVTANSLRLVTTAYPPTADASAVSSIDSVEDLTLTNRPLDPPIYTGGPPTTNEAEFDLTSGVPSTVDQITLDTTGNQFTVEYWDGAAWQNTSIVNQAGTAGYQTFTFTEVTTDKIRISLLPPVDASGGGFGGVVDVSSLDDNGVNAVALNAATTEEPEPIPPDNVDSYTISSGAEKIDRILLTATAGQSYDVEFFNGAASVYSLIGRTGTGAQETINILSAGAEVVADRIEIRVPAYDDQADVQLDQVINRIDRDGDLFPDVIEDANGSNPNSAASLPFGATAGPDDDNDGFLDYPTQYDPVEVDFLANTNPFGFTWADGSGNALHTANGQYGAAGATVPANLIPDDTDSDGDTLPDALDPFPNNSEFTTWVDGAAAYKGGNIAFISNRMDPDPANLTAQDLYLFDGTTYMRLSATGDAANPAFSEDGEALAWEQGGNLWVSFIQQSCNGTAPVTMDLGVAGQNPAWSPDKDQVIYENGGQIYIADAPGGAVTDPGISGSHPSWSPDGDHIAYERGGSVYVYNLELQREFDIGLGGTNPVWSPNGDKLAFEAGGDVRVVDVDIIRDPQVLQVDANSEAADQIEFSLADARISALGLNPLSLRGMDNAVDAIDLANAAIDSVSNMRAYMGEVERRLYNVMDDLHAKRINMAAANSKIVDLKMDEEISALSRRQIVQATAQNSVQLASLVEEGNSLNSIRRNVDLVG